MDILLGFEAHVASVKLLDGHLYLANSVETFTIPTNASQLGMEGRNIVGCLFDFKVGKK